MIGGANRNIENVRQPDMAPGEVIYRVKHPSRDSGQANDRQFEKQFKKDQENDDQDKTEQAAQEKHGADDAPAGSDYSAEIQDGIILSSEAKEILSKNQLPSRSTPADNVGKDSNPGQNNARRINLKA